MPNNNLHQNYHISDVYASKGACLKIRDTPLPRTVGAISVSKLWNDLVGVEIDQKSWRKSEIEGDELKVQSERIAKRLEGQGIRSRSEGRTTIIGICSGYVEKVITYRNTNIIPVMQSRSRFWRYFIDVVKKITA